MYVGGNGAMMMAWMGVLGLGVLAALVVLIVWAVRTSTPRPAHSAQQMTDAEALLRRRYAAGEIDDEEYQRRLATLRGLPPGQAGQGGTRQ